MNAPPRTATAARSTQHPCRSPRSTRDGRCVTCCRWAISVTQPSSMLSTRVQAPRCRRRSAASAAVAAFMPCAVPICRVQCASHTPLTRRARVLKWSTRSPRAFSRLYGCARHSNRHRWLQLHRPSRVRELLPAEVCVTVVPGMSDAMLASAIRLLLPPLFHAHSLNVPPARRCNRTGCCRLGIRGLTRRRHHHTTMGSLLPKARASASCVWLLARQCSS